MTTMTAVEEALTWSGNGADVSVFVVTRAGAGVALDTTVGDDRPQPSVFPLDQDDPPSLPGLDVVEVDAHFGALPGDLAGYVTTLLQRALDGGAVVAWCAFEGSFHFDHLLTGDVADQVYGVASRSTGVRLALDDATRTGAGWRDVLGAARAPLSSTA